MVLVEDGLKAAVTPAGRPETAKSTLPVKPSAPVTVTVLLAVEFAARLRLAFDAERLKLAAVTVTSIVVLLEESPDFPFTFILYLPAAAVLLAVTTRELVLLVVAGLNVAVTPFGRSDAARLTLPLKPFCPSTMMVVMPALPPVETVTLLDETARLRLGAIASAPPAEHPLIMTIDEAKHRAIASPNQRSPPGNSLAVRTDNSFMIFLPHGPSAEIPHNIAYGSN
ncbi:MAG TPA: hypothetical protein VMV57_14700 [Terracidiphilus sp.]|nr:hypothetical protein [Terracidiphilus sp.]